MRHHPYRLWGLIHGRSEKEFARLEGKSGNLLKKSPSPITTMMWKWNVREGHPHPIPLIEKSSSYLAMWVARIAIEIIDASLYSPMPYYRKQDARFAHMI